MRSSVARTLLRVSSRLTTTLGRVVIAAALTVSLAAPAASAAVTLDPDVPISETIDPIGELDLHTFTLAAATRVVLQGTSSAFNVCLRVLTDVSTPPITGGTTCVSTVFTGAARLDLVAGGGDLFRRGVRQRQQPDGRLHAALSAGRGPDGGAAGGGRAGEPTRSRRSAIWISTPSRCATSTRVVLQGTSSGVRCVSARVDRRQHAAGDGRNTRVRLPGGAAGPGAGGRHLFRRGLGQRQQPDGRLHAASISRSSPRRRWRWWRTCRRARRSRRSAIWISTPSRWRRRRAWCCRARRARSIRVCAC